MLPLILPNGKTPCLPGDAPKLGPGLESTPGVRIDFSPLPIIIHTREAYWHPHVKIRVY